MKKVIALLMLLAVGAIASCSSEVVLTDVGHDEDYRHLIGRQYEIVGRVDAYGIRDHSKADVEYITLIPPPGIDGYEVGFRVPIERGSKVSVIKVMKSNRWLVRNLVLVVKVDGTSMPVNMDARIELFRGNEGEEGGLNTAIYRELTSRRP